MIILDLLLHHPAVVLDEHGDEPIEEEAGDENNADDGGFEHHGVHFVGGVGVGDSAYEGEWYCALDDAGYPDDLHLVDVEAPFVLADAEVEQEGGHYNVHCSSEEQSDEA